MAKMWKFLLPTLCGIVIISLIWINRLPAGQPDSPVQTAATDPQPDKAEPPLTAQTASAPQPAPKAPGNYDASRMGTMFGAPTAPAPPSAPPPAPAPVPASPPAAPPAPEDPLLNIAYTGHAIIEGRHLALLENSKTHEGSWLTEGDTFRGFTVEHIAPEGLRLRQGQTNRNIAISDKFNPVPLTGDAPITVLPDPGNLAAYRGKTGMSYNFRVTGRRSGSVWGNGVYTDDSDIGTAAVHAGLLNEGQQGVVMVTILPGYDHYDGSTSNGITSNSYATWQGSYRISK